MNTRSVIDELHQRYGGQKWVLSEKELWRKHDSLDSFDRKFQCTAVSVFLHKRTNNILFGLKSGVVFDRSELLLIGDSMDEFHYSYYIDESPSETFFKFEGYTMYYRNDHEEVRKMTLSGEEISFFKAYISSSERLLS